MPVEKTERQIADLMGGIARGEIRLPEIQRGYVWKPTQVARLVESLYKGYPTGSLLVWKTTETPLTRDFAVTGTPPQPVIQPLYLLDSQQRLTALYKALGNDPNTKIVFNVVTQAFQNQSAANARDPRWVLVRDVVRPDADLFEMADQLYLATEVPRTAAQEQPEDQPQQPAPVDAGAAAPRGAARRTPRSAAATGHRRRDLVLAARRHHPEPVQQCRRH
jgi:hypothetical protein